MSDEVYAVVGPPDSGHTGVALDLAGAFATGGAETVLVELDPDSPYLLDLLDLGLEFVFRSTVEQVLGGSADPAGDVTPVSVSASGVESLGILPADTAEGPEAYSLDGLGEAVEALRAAYDVVVLDVGIEDVTALSSLGETADRSVVVTSPDGDRARRASRLAARLEGNGVAVAGAVVTDCAEESDLWSAKSRLDREVLTVVPPVRPDRVEVVGDRIRTLREELTDTDAIFSTDEVDIDEDAPVRSLMALVDGTPSRASIGAGAEPEEGTAEGSPAGSTGGDRPAGPEDGEPRAEPPGEGPAGASERVTSPDREPDALTPLEATRESEGDRDDGSPDGTTDFEFGELPSTSGRGDDRRGEATPETETEDGDDHRRPDRSTADLVDRISEILDGSGRDDGDEGGE